MNTDNLTITTIVVTVGLNIFMWFSVLVAGFGLGVYSAKLFSTGIAAVITLGLIILEVIFLVIIALIATLIRNT
ncbi:MAG: hypothetical protein GY861_02585 [bacterium]|nr:hypothetical protein [bacterium]